MTTFLKESVEFQHIVVTRDGIPATDFEVSIVPFGQRPSEWATAIELDGKYGIMIQNLDPGQYSIYTKIRDDPETPVLLAGRVSIR